MAHRRRGRTVDYKAWLEHTGLGTEFASATTQIGLGGLSFTAPGTILRCHYSDLLVMFDATQQVDDSMTITMGLGIVSTDAFTVGDSAMPDPVGDIGYPWLMWDTFALESQLAAGQQAIGATVVRRSYDVKSMRRVKPDQTLVWVIQSGDATGAPVTIYNMRPGRVLIGT